jgi:hypothetical protein
VIYLGFDRLGRAARRRFGGVFNSERPESAAGDAPGSAAE